MAMLGLGIRVSRSPGVAQDGSERGVPVQLGMVKSALLVWSSAVVMILGPGVIPGEGEALSELTQGLALRSQGKYWQALDAFSKVPASSPSYTRALVLRGALLEDLGRPKDAEEAYRQALALDTRYEAARRNLSQLLGARSMRVPVEGPHPSQDILMQKGLAALHREDFQSALNTFRLLHGLFPQDPRMRFYCALTWDRWGERYRAVEIYRGIVADFPDYAPARVNLIIALIRSGDKRTAADQTQAALERLPDNHRIKFLARLLRVKTNAPSPEESRVSLQGNH